MGEVAKSTVSNVKSIAWNGNSDGIHLGGDSLMEHCFFFVNDDCLIGNNGDNNTWKDCTVWRGPWGHPIVSLLSKRTSRNYLWENIDVISTEGKGPIMTLKNYNFTAAAGAGSFSDFTVRNIRVEGPRVGPLIKIQASLCQIKDYLVENVTTESRLTQEGVIAMPKETEGPTLTLKNVMLGGTLLLSADEVNMEVSGDQSGVSFSK
jgi:hypothetical protein